MQSGRTNVGKQASRRTGAPAGASSARAATESLGRRWRTCWCSKGRTCNTVKVIGNLQIVNGMGKTDTTNGCGNLIVGYNEGPSIPSAGSGSHNIIAGRFHSHASYACLLTGERNFATASAPSSCVVGGSDSHGRPIARWSSAVARTMATAPAASSSAVKTTAPTARTTRWSLEAARIGQRPRGRAYSAAARTRPMDRARRSWRRQPHHHDAESANSLSEARDWT